MARQSACATEVQTEAASGMASAAVSIDQVRDHARAVVSGAGDESRAGGQVVHSSAEEFAMCLLPSMKRPAPFANWKPTRTRYPRSSMSSVRWPTRSTCWH